MGPLLTGHFWWGRKISFLCHLRDETSNSTEKHGIIRPEKVGVQEGRKTVADLNFGQTMATCVPEDAEFSPLYAY